jgi:septal ring factor EnvC (AmiA/AmiB activator)
MTKLLLLLSALAMAGASFFAYQNGRTFKEIRADKVNVQHTVKVELETLTSTVDDITKENGTIATVQGQVDTEGEKLKSNKLKINQVEGDTKRVEDELKSKKEEMDKLTVQLNKLPPGFTPQTITEDLNKIKQEIAELETQAESKKQEVATADKKVVDAKKTLDDILAKIEARKKSFERNGLKARIVAVNSEWGFCVVDAGEKEGITPDTKLLIVRGTQTVGKLSIIEVSGPKTVAGIIADSLAPGMQPAPGDQVILENLFQ